MNACDTCQRDCPDRAPNTEFEYILACQGHLTMNCGDCAFWEPKYIELMKFKNLGKCMMAEHTLTPPVLRCVTGNWCPRPTLEQILDGIVKESGASGQVFER